MEPVASIAWQHRIIVIAKREIPTPREKHHSNDLLRYKLRAVAAAKNNITVTVQEFEVK